ncbi:AraC family transcriptional regulator [Bradyrhizobium sp. U87765 SZCCT0131]|uniref:AraC family transcriptional regulator n=1 Tax=unclassified Bradyrhizobium TaxID=2631580 RepID=UPI001BA66DC0|nr:MULTISPECIES: AraC family transcriptional regulator [unclassified Bradyrhizobium]MBR1223186.1 AraC family transcriptional regulator [Bradyrhizobium sp. U87765 SZCCT0131]MBR1265807.1 AraC family transcriptional regulator [Bradyrhizobium sp. U87765 SZCCT0134]MBR1309400.1 AraC family transcriptional regulator [Bradyrhizobium sp. U87765 SZCCT0110]MBR1324078.1 AraC family transcriptional regulator [Bradyrhizobium sp. U87765 SZCCT0109]MBR1348231.1 AraC family transcriptional regulator [Bradyrhizo
MDPLSDVLALLRPRSTLSAGLDAGGDWSLAFPMHAGIKFNAVLRGTCWVSVEGWPERQRLDEGDCFLLTRGRPFTLTTDPALDPVDSGPIYEAARNGIAICNGGGHFRLVGGRFTFAGDHASALFESLPPIVHVRQATHQASVLRWCLDQLASELHGSEAGTAIVAEHLAHIMLVHVLRLYLAAPDLSPAETSGQTTPHPRVGWFFALADRQLGAALRAMHTEPARRWSLEELAQLAGMSRTIFAERFRQRVGLTPMAYLTRWRMLIAGDRLRQSGETIAAIAFSLGYDSESAFSTAFKRTMACSPRQYQRQRG